MLDGVVVYEALLRRMDCYCYKPHRGLSGVWRFRNSATAKPNLWAEMEQVDDYFKVAYREIAR